MPKTCIIIPCYNEAARLPANDFRRCIAESSDMYFCFVNDGSRDNTSEVLNRFSVEFPGRAFFIDNALNKGKAEAVRTGMNAMHAKNVFDFIGYFDADLATPLEEIKNMLQLFDRFPRLQMVVGSRIKRLGSKIARTSKRHYSGRVFATFASRMMELDVYDTQCGAKIFRPALIKDIFNEPFISRWIFDIEIFFRIIKLSGKKEAKSVIFEYPLNTWEEKKGLKFRPVICWKCRLN